MSSFAFAQQHHLPRTCHPIPCVLGPEPWPRRPALRAPFLLDQAGTPGRQGRLSRAGSAAPRPATRGTGSPRAGPGVPTRTHRSILEHPATVLPMLKRPLLRMFMATCRERGVSGSARGPGWGDRGPGGLFMREPRPLARGFLDHRVPGGDKRLGREAQSPPSRPGCHTACSQPSVQSAQKGRGRPPRLGKGSRGLDELGVCLQRLTHQGAPQRQGLRGGARF